MNGVFEGLKILDFTWVVVGPKTVRYFADQGATVIKVESLNHPDQIRTAPPFKNRIRDINSSTYFTSSNANKFSIGINIRNAKGIEVLKKLVAWADVICESFAPGVMENLGLSYDELKKIKPGIIYLRTNMMGSVGSRSGIRGYGIQLVGHAGFTYITGWPDRIPAQPYGPYTDAVAPPFAASALLLALINKRRTGEGAYIDVSQHEAGIQFLMPILIDYQVTGTIKEREGNADARYCPNGVYPCRGEDRYIAISVTDDEKWGILRGIIASEELRYKRFDSFSERKKNEDEINSMILAWTVNLDAEEVMALLQNKGIAAGVVKNSKDIIEDPQLKYRKAIWYLNHDVVGEHIVIRQGFELSQNPYPTPKPAPLLGEHTYQICKEILCMPDEEIANLLGEGILQIAT